MRYRAEIAYDGTAYGGWQIQPNAVTVQEKLQEALKKLTQQDIAVTAAGRTDAGVHALGQVVHFDCDKEFSNIARAINSQLPDDIYVRECVPVNDDFHARYDAGWKYYSYMINTGEYDPLHRNHVCQLCQNLDLEAMQKAAGVFVGKHDFTSFNATKLSEMENQIREIYRCEVKNRNGIVSIDVVGNGFLRHMVRMIAGTLIEVGKGNLTFEDVRNLLESRDKDAVHYNAPACGLYLVKIGYLVF